MKFKVGIQLGQANNKRFNRLARCRGVRIRCDRLPQGYIGFVQLAYITNYLKILQ